MSNDFVKIDGKDPDDGLRAMFEKPSTDDIDKLKSDSKEGEKEKPKVLVKTSNSGYVSPLLLGSLITTLVFTGMTLAYFLNLLAQ